MGEYNEAEKVAEKHTEGRESCEAHFQCGFVLIDFLKYNIGCFAQNTLEDSLMKTTQCNNYVYHLLLNNKEPQNPERFSPGDIYEANN